MVITGSSSLVSGYISMSCTERRNQYGWDPASGGGWGEHRGTQKPQDREQNQTSELYGRFHTAFLFFTVARQLVPNIQPAPVGQPVNQFGTMQENSSTLV